MTATMYVKKIVISSIFLLLFATNMNAQQGLLGRSYSRYGKVKEKGNYPLWQRLSLGYGVHFISTKADFTYRTVINQFYSTSQSMNGSGSMVVSADVYFPVSHFNDQYCFAIGFGVNYLSNTLKHDSVKLGTTALKQDLKMAVIGVPISLDFKKGGDAAQSKEFRTMYTIGAGIQPMYIQSDGFASEGSKSIGQDTKIMSFIKVEFGAFAGMAFKLRGMAYIGQLSLVDRQETIIKEGTKDVILGYRRTTSSGQLGYTVSLIVMPGSIGWKKY